MSDENYEANEDFHYAPVVAENEPEDEEVNFEKELENYLPTLENTNKVKKSSPPKWLLNIGLSMLTCIIMLLIYSVFILPNLRPTAVISYATDSSPEVSEEIESFGGMIEKASQSVVAISGKSDYRSFFGISTQTNSGTGIIISENGYILTSNSLVSSNQETTVTIGSEKFRAKLVGQDIAKDVAIIQIDKTGLSPITLADSDSVHIGDTAIVLGNILGEELGISATKGIVCGINKGISLSNGVSANLIQTDAATSNTCAGGCVLNSSGNVVGMITLAISSGNDSISLAIPSNDISSIAESLINTGLSSSGLTIGITGNDAEHGVTVESVKEDSPAEKAGIKKGDLILKADDTVVKSVSEINKIRDRHKKGDKLKLTIYSDGEISDIDVSL